MLYFEVVSVDFEGELAPSTHAVKPNTRAVNAVIYVIFLE
jgi:hypothetical protein